MIPSNRWFPRGLPERAMWYENFSVNFAEVAASLGLTDDVAWVRDDNYVMQFLADVFVQITAFEKAVCRCAFKHSAVENRSTCD